MTPKVKSQALPSHQRAVAATTTEDQRSHKNDLTHPDGRGQRAYRPSRYDVGAVFFAERSLVSISAHSVSEVAAGT